MTAIARLSADIETEYRARTRASQALFERAKQTMPGGVSGNLRYFAPHPLYMARGQGAITTDVDGNDYIDSFLCNGPLLLGHRPKNVMESIERHKQTGPLVLNPALLLDCAERVCAMIPCAERVRFVNSGTEALMAAARYSRGYTGRSKVLKFFGHYHGQDDQFLVGASPYREPFGKGVPETAYARTLTVPFNDIDALHATVAKDDDIAAIVLDPAMHSGGLWSTTKPYLEGVRELASKKQIVLIFDEVITGFRLAPGGAQERYGVTPDLATFAKAIGAGERLAAVAGRADIMSVVDPVDGDPARRVFQSGTGNDCTAGLAAGFAAMDLYREHGERGDYELLEARAADLAAGLRTAFGEVGIPCHVNQSSSMLQLFLTDTAPGFIGYSTLSQRLVDLFYLAISTQGSLLSLPTSNHIYLSFAHGQREIEHILAAAREVLHHFNFAEAYAQTA